MPVDISAWKRRYKPERFLTRLAYRGGAELVSPPAAIGTRRVLLDTTVYIHEASGRLPEDAALLRDGALRFHCSLCIAEIIAGLSHLHPKSAKFTDAWAHFQRLFSGIPASRTLTPDIEILVQAGMISGALARTQNYPANHRRALFNDVAIYLTASRLGLPLLTANRNDFDIIQQAAGHGSFIHYTVV